MVSPFPTKPEPMRAVVVHSASLGAGEQVEGGYEEPREADTSIAIDNAVNLGELFQRRHSSL